jgi:hemolysin III
MPAPDLSGDIRRRISLDPPRFRGVLHAWSIPVAVLAGIGATLAAPTALTRILVAVYGVTLVAMLSFSAVFHRFRWTDDSWWRMRRLDHTGIFLVIAGSFTGIAGLSLEGGARVGLLAAVWVIAGAGIAYRWLPIVPPFGLTTVLYVLLTAMIVPFLPDLGAALGPGGVILLLVSCAIYLGGALALGARVPDPVPHVFGYHEVWHVVVIVCSALQYVVLVAYAIPAAREMAQNVAV